MFDDAKKEALSKLKEELKTALLGKFKAAAGDKSPAVVGISVEKTDETPEDTVEKPADAGGKPDESEGSADEEAAESADDEAKEGDEGPEAPLSDTHRQALAILRALKPAAKKG